MNETSPIKHNTVRIINPFTTDPVKVLHFAILV